MADNTIGGHVADANLRRTLLGGISTTIISLVIVGFSLGNIWTFGITSVVLDVASFANVSPMQMGVMRHAGQIKDKVCK